MVASSALGLIDEEEAISRIPNAINKFGGGTCECLPYLERQYRSAFRMVIRRHRFFPLLQLLGQVAGEEEVIWMGKKVPTWESQIEWYLWKAESGGEGRCDCRCVFASGRNDGK